MSAPYVKDSETSKAAAKEINKADRQRVLDYIVSKGREGSTDYELERDLELKHQTASARRRGLEQSGLVVLSDKKRPTDSGRQAGVYVSVDAKGKTKLPDGPDWWQWQHQNYARLLIKAGMRSNGKFDRTAIISVLDEVERIQGEKERQVMSDFLNHEKESLTDGFPLIKPQSVIDHDLAHEASLHTQKAKDDKHEQQKLDVAVSDKFIEKLAS